METKQDMEFKSRNELLALFVRRQLVKTMHKGGIYVVVGELPAKAAPGERASRTLHRA